MPVTQAGLKGSTHLSEIIHKKLSPLHTLCSTDRFSSFQLSRTLLHTTLSPEHTATKSTTRAQPEWLLLEVGKISYTWQRSWISQIGEESEVHEEAGQKLGEAVAAEAEEIELEEVAGER